MQTDTTAPAVYVTEADWRQLVLDFAQLRGWRCYWTWRSDHSPKGYPDLTLVRGERLIFAELKRDRERVTPPQQAWIADLLCVPCAEVHVWRPADWPAVQAVLA